MNLLGLSFAEWLLLQEGAFDPQAFKAVIILGGPGTGKSYITDFFKGFKPVNSDSLFEKYLIAQKVQGAGKPDGTNQTISSRSRYAAGGEPNAGEPMRTWTAQGHTSAPESPLIPTGDTKFTRAMHAPTWPHEDLPLGKDDKRGYNLGQFGTGPEDPPLARGIDMSKDALQLSMKKRAGLYANTLAGVMAPGIEKSGDFQGGSAEELGKEGERRTHELGFEPHPFRGNPLVLETTGQTLAPLKEDVPAMQGLGYDVWGVMVNCLHIDSALRSNFERGESNLERGKAGRSLREGLVVGIHLKVKKNLKDLEDGFNRDSRGYFQINVDRIPPAGYDWLTDDELMTATNDPRQWDEITKRKGLYDKSQKWKFADSGKNIGKVVSDIQRMALQNEVGLEWLKRERAHLLATRSDVRDDPRRPTPGATRLSRSERRSRQKRLPPWQGSLTGDLPIQ